MIGNVRNRIVVFRFSFFVFRFSFFFFVFLSFFFFFFLLFAIFFFRSQNLFWCLCSLFVFVFVPVSASVSGSAHISFSFSDFVFAHFCGTRLNGSCLLFAIIVMTEEKRYARSQKFSIPDQMWSIQAEDQGMRPADIFCQDPDRADPEPMVRRRWWEGGNGGEGVTASNSSVHCRSITLPTSALSDLGCLADAVGVILVGHVFFFPCEILEGL